MDYSLEMLPHQPPMRLVENVLEITPGKRAVCGRFAHDDDFYFQGHFPDNPIVPAVVLVELLAQTGGIAVASGEPTGAPPMQLRVAAFGAFRFPAAARPGAFLEARADVVGGFGGAFKIDGTVTASGVLVATGSVVLAGR